MLKSPFKCVCRVFPAQRTARRPPLSNFVPPHRTLDWIRTGCVCDHFWESAVCTRVWRMMMSKSVKDPQGRSALKPIILDKTKWGEIRNTSRGETVGSTVEKMQHEGLIIFIIFNETLCVTVVASVQDHSRSWEHLIILVAPEQLTATQTQWTLVYFY